MMLNEAFCKGIYMQNKAGNAITTDKQKCSTITEQNGSIICGLGVAKMQNGKEMLFLYILYDILE